MTNRADSETSGHSRDGSCVRRRLDVWGRVQGVGFRPFVYRLADELGLGGYVSNTLQGAELEVEGPPEAVRRFLERLEPELPPLARIASVTETVLEPRGDRSFAIRASIARGIRKVGIAPDTATCPDCRRELFDPADRRFRYPFTNCTNCGPRYSIIRSVPYDRPNTTMACFPMCSACQGEYDAPGDRRFHAQPNACGECGPRARLVDAAGREVPGDAIRVAARLLADGAIVAVKGLGGFHLACRADSDEAVSELRRRKGREAKPLAVMVSSRAEAEQLTVLDDVSAAALVSPICPIVLAPKRSGVAISRHVAPGTDCFGVMLAYTPLHALLFAEGLDSLVMTSGNPSAEPLCGDNEEALKRLGGIADAFLLHDRDIERRVDDSVVMCAALPSRPGTDGGRGPESVTVPLRRARGHVPDAIRVPVPAVEPVLALGGEMKSTVCVLAQDQAVLSEHLGELSNPAAYRNFLRAIECFQALLDLRPRVVAHDMHPEYASTRYAQGLDERTTAVQHHHAHMVSCMAENGLRGRVVGVTCDGTGFGTDGTIWGCEVLVGDESGFERRGHLGAFPLLGGDAAAVDTWRPAAGLLAAVYGADWVSAAAGMRGRFDSEAVAVAATRFASDSHPVVRTSSLGRLFDGVAFLVGTCARNRFEAEAAMGLQVAAAGADRPESLPWGVAELPDGTLVMEFNALIDAVVAAVGKGVPVGRVARGFHEAVAQMLAACTLRTAAREDLHRVVLSGGCFANRLLLERLWELLGRGGVDVYIHRLVPPGDGGISLGQAVVANARLRQGHV